MTIQRLHIRSLFLLFAMLLGFSQAYATHNRAGEITYRHISGYTYEITITTYTKASSTAADRCELTLDFGDGQIATVRRINGPSLNGCNIGVEIGNDIKLNIYRINHTYNGPGNYILSMQDPNRNAGIENINNSVSVPFYIYSELIIYAQGGPNSSPRLTYAPIDNGCICRRFEHNPGAIDMDLGVNGQSDSLSYELVPCRGDTGGIAPGYVLPSAIMGNGISCGVNDIAIDSISGTVEWMVPQKIGEYNIAILITEWRKIGGTYIKVGSVLRDMQITVAGCNNYPPVISNVGEFCVESGETMIKNIVATDADVQDRVTIQATGEPFEVDNSPATFPNKTGVEIVSQDFEWATLCEHVRNYPYFVVFKAEDSNPFNLNHVPLVDFEEMWINVVGSEPEDFVSAPDGNGIQLDWRGDFYCDKAVGYKVYRHIDSTGWQPSECETGVPDYTGYQLIAQIPDINVTSYFDDDNGAGLIHGLKYCYLVHAYYEDGAESYASLEVCSELKNVVPIMTQASVIATDAAAGADSVQWVHPTELDLTQYPGPYQYKIYRRAQLGSFTEIGQTNVDAVLNNVDTVFFDENIDTRNLQYDYRVELYSGSDLAGTARFASTIFLDGESGDNFLTLSWDFDVPWTNQYYLVYKQRPDLSFELLDTAFTSSYTDRGLVNGEEYCYYVESYGVFSGDSLPHPINKSQIWCGSPVDLVPPCPVELNIDSDCELYENRLQWTNPNEACGDTDDAVSYNVYFKPSLDAEYERVLSVSGAENTSFVFDNLESVAGCYYITAVDSFNNESDTGQVVCVDNCPIYELPNVFTPGGDGFNDLFQPFPYRYVDRVDIYIYDRWGQPVFHTEDPNVLWDGRYEETGEYCTAGVYFYLCTVYEIRLEGIVPRVIKGHVTLMQQDLNYPNE